MASITRQLTVGTKGEDVRDVIRAANRHRRQYGFPQLAESTRLSYEALQGVRSTGLLLGAPDAQVAVGEPISQWLQILVRAPWRIWNRDRNTKRRATERLATRRRLLARRANPRNQAQIADYLLRHPNVRFWTSSTGPERRIFEGLARTGRAYVPVTGEHLVPKLATMRFLLACARAGHVHINCLTGGRHSSLASGHYKARDVDIDLCCGSTARREWLARQHGGSRNFERDHEHYDFD